MINVDNNCDHFSCPNQISVGLLLLYLAQYTIDVAYLHF